MSRYMIKAIARRAHIGYLRMMTSGREALRLDGTTLIVAPHPDDEVIGCGGLIARLMAEGKTPHIVVMTGGGGSHRGCCSTPESEIVSARRQLTRDALAILGVPETNIHELDFVDGNISAENKQEMRRLSGLISELQLQPDNILVPHWGEGWNDHVTTARIIRNLVGDKPIKIWEYCVWMWYYNIWRGLDWKNARCLNLTEAEQLLKFRAVDAYTLPLAPCGKPWSGVLPKAFLDANRSCKELYFEVK